MMKPYQFSCALSEETAFSFDFVSFSLDTQPSPLVVGCFEGGKAGIGSQIAVRMSREACVRVALECQSQEGLDIVRNVLSEANQQVYQYGHRMAAGGQIAARGVVGVFDGDKMYLGQVGSFGHYLWRNNALHPFYEPAKDEQEGVLTRFIGANAKVLVDLASVNLKNGDLVISTTLAAGAELEATIKELLQEQKSVRVLSRRLANLGFAAKAGTAAKAPGFAALIAVGETEPVVLEELDA